MSASFTFSSAAFTFTLAVLILSSACAFLCCNVAASWFTLSNSALAVNKFLFACCVAFFAAADSASATFLLFSSF
ncbi:hypothetical protein NIES3275_01410 [Microchaete diplosiphon NIES-3275]|nr:hypothetical protein NIES3275_01410 [Microchaete diplosiphon NIES-3275]